MEIWKPSGTAVTGIFSKSGKRVNGGRIVQSIAVLHNRSNGLGGGLADYNIYPQARAKQGCAVFSEKYVDLANLSRISTRQVKGIVEAPLSRKCFVPPLPHKPENSRLDKKAFTPAV